MGGITVFYLMWYPTPGKDGITEWFVDKDALFARGRDLKRAGFEVSGYPCTVPTTPDALVAWLNEHIDIATKEDAPETP